jgi:REP element-mobilizing transposase RayT
MAAPLAYFISWSCYASWLHGDPRGSVNHYQNKRGEPLVRGNPGINRFEATQTDSPPGRLDGERRALIERAIRDHCAFRKWPLHALNVRTNHVHVVVTCPCETHPDQVLIQFKAWATRRLREAGLAQKDARIWTKHGSTKWNDPAGLGLATNYVLNRQ